MLLSSIVMSIFMYVDASFQVLNVRYVVDAHFHIY